MQLPCVAAGRNDETKMIIKMERRAVNEGLSSAQQAERAGTVKGFVRTTNRADALQRDIGALTAAGVAVREILIGESVREALESMRPGDILVLCSLGCCGGLRGAAELLVTAAGRGVTVRALEERIDTSVPPADWASAAGLFQRLEWSHRSERVRASLRVTKAEGHRRPGRPKPERLKRGLCEALSAYYATERSVREICGDMDFDPSVLYRCIDQNGLPRRNEIAENPSRHPFSEGKPLRVRMGDEWVKVAPTPKTQCVPVSRNRKMTATEAEDKKRRTKRK